MKKILNQSFLIFVPILLSMSAFGQNVGINILAPAGKLHVKGSENITQLIIDADTIQSNTSPLIKLRKFDGTELMWIQADDSTNCFIGFKSGRFNLIPDGINGVNNSFIGSRAGYSNTNGRDNTVFGTKALYSNTKGSGNTAIGTNALFMQSYDLIGSWYATNNVAIGQEALFSNQPTSTSNGVNNTAVGFRSMRQNTTGVRNVGTGMFSIYYNTLGNDNVAIGYTSLFFNSTGNFNTANGAKALFLNTTGSKNTALGYDAGVISANLTNTTAIGYNAKVDTSNALVLGGTGMDAVRVGIGTQKPQAVLDVNGDLVLRSMNLAIADGVTLALDINTSKFSYYRLTGPTAQFELAGITAGIPGRLVSLFNASGFPMQLNNADNTAVVGNQIITGTNDNLLLENMGMVMLRYDGTEQKWIVSGSNRSATAGIWESSGSDIYFDNNVGIGTDEPDAPLTIQTGLDQAGFSHMTDVSSTVVTSEITSIGGSVGTSSEDIFSLNAGGEGKVHVWPDGRVVIGDDADPLSFAGNHYSRTPPVAAKLTLETPINSAGWVHVGGADSIIVTEAIGGVSASIGTSTNHNFRLNTNAQGRLHILNDGNIIVGTNAQGPVGKFTVHTLNNTNGLTQVGGDGQILAMRIGGSSGSIGTWTPHIMRIVANSVAVINIDPSGNVAIGTPDPLPGYKLSVNGNVKAKELVIETTGWPDYVFEKDYKSLSLSELENFISQHHHLPNIPSAREVEKDGTAVGEMQKKMMEKIEELTLYIIELNKEIQLLKQSDK